jgi:elongator complex protein 3
VKVEPDARLQEAISHIAKLISDGGVRSRDGVEKLKKQVALDFSLDRYVSNSEILAALPEPLRQSFREMLRVHPRRSASGIVVITAFTEPFPCPHGTCVFCPGGPRLGTPQSYLRDSPGMRSALSSSFDPFEQVRKCLLKYESNGHETGKAETIVEGGTFIADPRPYQLAFVKGVYEGLNGFRSASLQDAQSANEIGQSRCVGLTLETKPDWCRPEDVDLMLRYGVTRLEIGVQSLRDSTLLKSNRGHTVEDSVNAFQVARDAGLKVTAHMMPGLPGATPQEDLEDLRRLFEDEAFKPDMTKIYPTLVVEGTALAKMCRAGRYAPYDVEIVVELLSEMKSFVPRWHRIMRIQREIPAREISGGVRNGNLRELVLARAREKGHPCRCIRCREVALDEPVSLGEEDTLLYSEEKYVASGGMEVFGSYEYERSGKIAGFVRLRLPSDKAHRPELRNAAVVRELRVYGRVVRVGGRKENAWQHRGLGEAMLRSMEARARQEVGPGRILVTSAVGTRNYYRRLGYRRLGPYMSKRLV